MILNTLYIQHIKLSENPLILSNFTFDILPLVLLFQSDVQYTVLGIGSAPDYFYVDPNNGGVKIKQPLKDDPHKLNNYVVSGYQS